MNFKTNISFSLQVDNLITEKWSPKIIPSVQHLNARPKYVNVSNRKKKIQKTIKTRELCEYTLYVISYKRKTQKRCKHIKKESYMLSVIKKRSRTLPSGVVVTLTF